MTTALARDGQRGDKGRGLAHELFHLLTWDAMPPEHFEAAGDTSRNRVERLANNFAAAVLMPAEILGSAEGWAGLDRNALVARLNSLADELVGLPIEGLVELFAAQGVEHAIDL